MARDHKRVQDKEFRDRYIYGCEIIEILGLRIDTIGWGLFKNSFWRNGI